MALTKNQWFAKLKSWVPSWVFENQDVNVAIFMSIARLLQAVEEEAEFLKRQTSLDDAEGAYLDLHGKERDVLRVENESDTTYRERIRSLDLTMTPQSILNLVNRLLPGDDAAQIENESAALADVDLVADCLDSVWLNPRRLYNRFTIIIPKQPEGVDENILLPIILKAISDNKAFGTLFDVRFDGLLEALLMEDGDALLTEDGDELLLN